MAPLTHGPATQFRLGVEPGNRIKSNSRLLAVYPATGQYAEWAGRAAKRHFFLIDRDGIVRGKWMGEDMAVFSNEEILKVARQLGGTR